MTGKAYIISGVGKGKYLVARTLAGGSLKLEVVATATSEYAAEQIANALNAALEANETTEKR